MQSDSLDSSESVPVSVPGKMYVFPSAYGGVVQSTEPPQIHNLICELRRRVTLAAEKRSGVMFPVKDAKQLLQKLAEALNELNMTAGVVRQDVKIIDTSNIPKNENAKGNPVFRTLVHCKTTVRFTAPDGSFADFEGSGHGGDPDDKAGGKASTFSWKDAVLKGITIPAEELDDTDDEQQTKPNNNNNNTENRQTVPVSPEEDNTDLVENYLNRIAIADSAGLEAIRAEIKSGGKVKLHGTDKMTVARAFSARFDKLNPSTDKTNV
jgi:hypothetical protein